MDNFNNPQNKRKGTGFTNLNRYLQANQGNRLGSGITSGVQQQTQQAQQGIQKGFEGFQQERQKSAFDTEQNKQYAQNVLNAPFGLQQQDIDKFKAFREGQYAGPTGLQNTQQVQQGIQQAKDVAQLSGSQAGRRQLLESEVRSPNYTTGKRRLDDLFLGQVSPELQQARVQTRGLGNILSAKEQEAQNLARQTAEANKAFGQKITEDIGKTREQIVNPITQRLQTAQNIEGMKDDIQTIVHEMVDNNRYDPAKFATETKQKLKYLDIPEEELQKLVGSGDEYDAATRMLTFLDNFGLVTDKNLEGVKGLLTKAAQNRKTGVFIPKLIEESLNRNYAPGAETKGLNFQGVASSAELERLNTLAKLGGIDESFDPNSERYQAGKFGIDTNRGNIFLSHWLGEQGQGLDSTDKLLKQLNYQYNPDESGNNYLGSNAFQKLVSAIPNQQFTTAGGPVQQQSSSTQPQAPTTGGTLSTQQALNFSGQLGGPQLSDVLGSNQGGLPGVSGGTGIGDILGSTGIDLGGLSGGSTSGTPSITELPIILQNLKEGKLSQGTLNSIVQNAGIEGGGAYLAAANKLFGPQNSGKNFLDDPQLAAQLAASGVPAPIALAFAAPTALRTEGQLLNKGEKFTQDTGLNKLPAVQMLIDQMQSKNLANQQQLAGVGNLLDPRVSFSDKGVALKDLLKTSVTQPYDSIKGVGSSVKNIASQIADVGSVGRSIGNAAESAFKAASGAIGGIFCLAEGTQIVMSDGSIKNVESIDLGDSCFLGGTVFAKGVALEDDIYHYNNILVTGQHAIFENGKWLRVCDSPNAFKTDLNNIKVYPIANDNHLLITANGIVFADHQETDEGSTLTDDQRIEVLNKQNERNNNLSSFQNKLNEFIEVA